MSGTPLLLLLLPMRLLFLCDCVCDSIRLCGVQTKDAAAAAPAGSSGGARGGAGNILVEEGAGAAGGNPAMGVAEGAVADEELGEWGKVTSALTAAPGSGVGMSGVSKEKMEPFKWDDSIPKLADRRFSTRVHVRVYVYVYVNVYVYACV